MTFIENTPPAATPVIDYSSRDYLSIYNDLLERRSIYMPEWTSTSTADFGIALIQMFSYVGDIIGYYLDRLAGEAFIQTATQPVSILNLAAMLDYQPTLSVGASVNLLLTVSPLLASTYFPYTVPAGTQFSTIGTAAQAAIIFETTQAVTFPNPNGAGTTLAVALTANSTYTAITVAAGGISEALFVGDYVEILNTLATPSTQLLEVTSNASVGATAISVASFVANANYAIGSQVEYTDQALVPAVQGITNFTEAVGTSNGSLNQQFSLLYNPVSADSFSQGGIVTVLGAPTLAPTIVYVDLGLGPQPWTYVTNLANYGPNAQVYTSFVDADGTFYIVFGDSVNGFVPPLASPITCTYVVSDGVTGNVGANTIVSPVTALTGISCTNPLPANGGMDAESLTSIQLNAPASLKALNRAVTVQDFSTLAIQIPGVQWASAVEVTYQLVNLFVAPFGGGAPTSVLTSSVASFIDPLVMANTTVTLLSPTYVPINISANVSIYPNYGNTAVQQAVVNALNSLLALSNTGFGFRVSLGAVYNTILSVAGVNYANLTVLNRSMLALTTSVLTSGQSYSSIPVSALPQAVASGDTIVLSNGVSTQTLTASGAALAGAASVPVTPFLANATYAIGSTIQDTTQFGDCVLLANEIPEAPNSYGIIVSGGVVGS
jgi:hypothetical protein